MSGEEVKHDAGNGRKVRADTLAVAPEVLGLTLAEPWRRLASMGIDLVVVGLLSLLSGAFLAIATGLLLAVILGNGTPAPLILQLVRWICRGAGAVVVLLAILALGHSTLLHTDKLNLGALQGAKPNAALERTVFVPANASYGQLREATGELQDQVAALKKQVEAERINGGSWVGRVRALTSTLGLTFGWAGVYFTLITGLTNGRTCGKLVLGTRAAKINGSKFTFFDGFVRQGGYIAGVAMGMIGFVKMLWEPNRQTVEDRIAATVVVKR